MCVRESRAFVSSLFDGTTWRRKRKRIKGFMHILFKSKKGGSSHGACLQCLVLSDWGVEKRWGDIHNHKEREKERERERERDKRDSEGSSLQRSTRR